MTESIYARERYSVCIVHENDSGSRPYYKYFRVADYDPEADEHELIPPLLQKDAKTLEEIRANPDHLYNPAAVQHYDGRESDFYMFRWRLDPENFDRQLTRGMYDTNDGGVRSLPEPREVIIAKGVSGEAGLRDALAEGIPFEGRTTSVFYLVYERETKAWRAARCERKDFVFDGGAIRLRSSIDNARSTALSAPAVLLASFEVLESPHPETRYRMFYGRLDEPEVVGSVLLRHLDYYAADYVKWYVKESSLEMTRADRQSVAAIIDAALSEPDALEAYLGAGVPDDEVAALRASVASLASGEDTHAKELIRDALLSNGPVWEMCVAQVSESDDERIAAKRAELEELEAAVGSAEDRLASAEARLSELGWKSAELDGEIEAKRKEAGALGAEVESALEELESNVALRLGLRAASGSRQGAHGPGLLRSAAEERAAKGMDEPLEVVVAHNMQKAGLTSVSGRPNDERLLAATSIVASMAATHLLAMAQPVAHASADALSVARCGKTAPRVFVPSDCRDAGALADALSELDCPVVVIDNVIDPANEGMLFSLIGSNPAATIVLPFVSHASARLIAREVWESVFVPAVEGLVLCPGSRRAGGYARATGDASADSPDVDDVLEMADTLIAELDDLGLPERGFVLPAAVLCCADEIAEGEGTESVVSQHLAFATGLDAGPCAILQDWSAGDPGLACVAERAAALGR